ncbi:helix-turn-helix domain-containing protein [Nocardia higoensis]|uniref:helix-turn-helix domain-containing protein n=1 Tax=Nocardia higoensis TaxID=228599 RepID=UPI0002DD9DE3|nr:helix-turn-helix domain-containing protein [Nocardia higoensis]
MSDHENPNAAEQQQARQALETLRDLETDAPEGSAVDLTVAGTAEPVHLPPRALGPLREVLENLAVGRGVTVIPAHVELTTQQAAELLGVSRPHLVKLLHEGQIRYRFMGRRRRVLVSSLLEYRRKQEESGHSVGEDAVTLPEAVGLY